LTVREGDASEEIVLATHEKRPPIVVLGSRERSALRSVLGRVSVSVMTQTTAPIVVIPPGADPSSLDRDGPVLVGVDGSEASMRAVDVASDLAAAMRVDLYCLSVAEPRVEVPVVAAAAASAAVIESPGEIERRRQASLDAANDLAFSAADGMAAGALADVGDPATRLSAVAAEMDACLIVVGHAHRSALDRALRGSVASTLCRSASRPVLVAAGP
jgi:nucleotide-binding universal stress UspA family protein